MDGTDLLFAFALPRARECETKPYQRNKKEYLKGFKVLYPYIKAIAKVLKQDEFSEEVAFAYLIGDERVRFKEFFRALLEHANEYVKANLALRKDVVLYLLKKDPVFNHSLATFFLSSNSLEQANKCKVSLVEVDEAGRASIYNIYPGEVKKEGAKLRWNVRPRRGFYLAHWDYVFIRINEEKAQDWLSYANKLAKLLEEAKAENLLGFL